MVQEQAARDRERTKEQAAADRRKDKERSNQARREANRKNVRGGYSGVATGPFSLGSSKEGMSNSPHIPDYTNDCYRPKEQHKPRILGIRLRFRFSSGACQE